MAVIELVALDVMWFVNPALVKSTLVVMAAAFFGGQMPGILTGLELGLGSPLTLLVNIGFNTCWHGRPSAGSGPCRTMTN